MPKVIIIGSEGQDGRLLTNSLIDSCSDVLGIGRNSVKKNGLCDYGNSINISCAEQVKDLLSDFNPDEIYYLAAHHVSSEEGKNSLNIYDEYIRSNSTHVIGLLNFLDGMLKVCASSKLFYASSSLVFGDANSATQDEMTAFDPQGIYGMTKMQGILLCKEFRTKHHIFASSGILYNHESKFRSEKFLPIKIIKTALRILKGSNEKLVVGNLDAVVDWGHAADYVEAYQQILKLDKSGEYIVASGEGHSVREFIDIVFKYLGIDIASNVVVNQSILTRNPPARVGDVRKLMRDTGWRPSSNFNDFVIRLISELQSA
ncbi:GDP-mannose 4,6-dehydratase [Polynucleobacter alcilacus]|uniref:GDP-mannose 4,6-dehydratase n=1 Tax=Polynucleobacter alcilacus TaxID=1819739 RepID=UPI001C0BF106|nr:GDP-mannose 4,6-dehydratase [Polynucleobacter alcilacus]MBU3568187.1 GDP-mannose 4,6-dehydratase [Polynucleobacter alcilacus]